MYDLQNILEWKALRTLAVSTLPVRHLVLERELCRGEGWAASIVGQRDATEVVGVRDNNDHGRLCQTSHYYFLIQGVHPSENVYNKTR